MAKEKKVGKLTKGVDQNIAGIMNTAPDKLPKQKSAKGPTVAEMSHSQASTPDYGSIPGVKEASEIEAQKTAAANAVDQAKGNTEKGTNGLIQHFKDDIAHTKTFGNALKDSVGSRAAHISAGDPEMAKLTDMEFTSKNIQKAGGEYLEEMGRGHKGLGAAKIGGYMLGASMLVDMLNPFDDD